jgi:phospholipid-binding lipoprotein MlaA
MYSFNDTLDRYVMKPVAKGYRAVLPSPVRKGVSNFFSNLREPAVMINSALQGKFSQAASDLGRFMINTTFGIYGLFDVATAIGIERHNEDFGQTLGTWGVGEGPYLVLPLLGPSNIRDGVGLYADNELYPPNHLDSSSTRTKLYILEGIDIRARLLDAGDILDQAAGEDPYVFVREAYRQRRRSLIRDGADAGPAPLDPAIFEQDETAPKPPAPEPPKQP